MRANDPASLTRQSAAIPHPRRRSARRQPRCRPNTSASPKSAAIPPRRGGRILFAQTCDSRIDSFFAATVDVDRRSFVRAQSGDRKADPFRRARDEDGLARPLKIHVIPALESPRRSKTRTVGVRIRRHHGRLSSPTSPMDSSANDRMRTGTHHSRRST